MRQLWAVLSGVMATLVGLAFGHLVASLGDRSTSPVLAVGSAVIDLTPTPVKEWAVATFGTADKPLLIGGVLALTLVLAGLAGVLARRRFLRGAVVLLGLVGLAAGAVSMRPAPGVGDFVPASVAAVTSLAAMAWLTRARASQEAAAVLEPAWSGAGRRAVLILSGAAVVAGAAGEWVTRVRTRVADIVLPKPADPAGEFPVGLEKRFEGMSPLRTPMDSFYRVDTRLALPIIDVDTWSLSIDGDVTSPQTFSFADLLAMDLVERDITLNCVSNEVGGPYVGSARWLGVRLTDLLDRAQVGTRADQILSTDVDGFTISTPLSVATDGRDTLVAIGMNGGPLPQRHGFPARLITPGLYGFVGATKWLTRLTLTTYAADVAYWTERDWATDAPVKISSRIDTPASLATIEAGETVIGGVAWAQGVGVAKVEVSIDGQAWKEATIGVSVSDDYWCQWYLPWVATAGRHDLAVRATNRDGEVQTQVRATPFPSGSTGVQNRVVLVE